MNDFVNVTHKVKDPIAAVKMKMDQIEPKIFGRRVVSYDITHSRKVYVPCYYFSFDFDISRKIGLDRQGKIIFIYDLNQEFPFYFDPREDKLNIKKTTWDNKEFDFLPIKGTMNDALEKCNAMLQKRMFRFYRAESNTKLMEQWLFYRPAVELTLEYRKMMIVRYAYLDENETSSETLNGMKLRIES